MSRILQTGLLLTALTLAGCSDQAAGPTTSPTPTSTFVSRPCTEPAGGEATAASLAAANATIHSSPADFEWAESEVVDLPLSGDSVKISTVGTYRLSGTILNGQVVVDTSASGLVRLILDGVDIRNPNGAAIEIKNAPEVMIYLAAGSSNRVSDATSYPAEAAAKAAIFSTANLTIAGEGSLEVKGNGNDGIRSRDGLAIAGGNLSVLALDNAIRATDYVVVEGGQLDIKAGGDGVKSDDRQTNTRGFVQVTGGTLSIAVDADGIQATTDVFMTGGTTAISAGDDGINVNCVFLLGSGDLTISAADDGVHSDGELYVAGGSVEVTESFEGIEADSAYFSGGDSRIRASDDGINLSGILDDTGAPKPIEPLTGSAGDAFDMDVPTQITISGGSIYVDSGADGIDSNAGGTISGGDTTVFGPTGGDAAIDGNYLVTGGTLLALSGRGLTITPIAKSTQMTVRLRVAEPLAAGTKAEIVDASGKRLASFTLSKRYSSFVYSAPALGKGKAYRLLVAGSVVATGTAQVFRGEGEGGPKPGRRP